MADIEGEAELVLRRVRLRPLRTVEGDARCHAESVARQTGCRRAEIFG